MKLHLNKLVFALIMVFGLASLLNAQNTAIKNIEKEELLPIYRLDAYPSSGKIMFNAPSFICKPVIAEVKGINTYKFDYDYQYQFRISKDKDFKDKSTIVSPIQEWTIYNTHSVLEPGDWYWQYAFVKNGKKEWSEIIPFTVSGEEIDFVSPSFDQLLSNIENVHPRILTTPDCVGNVKGSESLQKKLQKKLDKKIGKKLPALIYDDQEVMAKKKKQLSEERYQLYITKRTRDNCKKFSAETDEVVLLYLMTKDRKYMDEAIKRYRHFEKKYVRIIELGQWLDFTEVAFHAVQSEVFDIAYDELSEVERTHIIKDLSEAQEKSYKKFLHKPSHKLHDSHFWQIELRNFFLNSLVLIHHTAEANKWLKYAYDLYIVRAPTGSLNDGGWAPGNKYFSANQETLFVLPYILGRITGFNYFSKPWYQNVPAYLMYTSPIGHLTGSFGDGTDSKGENMVPLIKAMNKVEKNPYGRFYQNLFKEKGTDGKDNLTRLKWYAGQKLSTTKKSKSTEVVFPLAKDFRDVGTVAMHTDLNNPNDNFFVAFRSSPFGVVGHSHAAQNSFSIFYGGESLFYHTGYYTNWADLHTLQSYRHTRAHNSILVDGMGQNFHSSGYGWIPRFLTGDVISYTMGDASRAYSGTIARDEIARQMKKYGVEQTPEYGFGDAGLKKFRRHMFMLRPGIAVVYDELEAEKPVDFTWLSNSRCTAELQGENGLEMKSKNSKASMKLFCSADFKQKLTDQFVSPVVDWQGKGKKMVKQKEISYHYKAITHKVKKARFLSVIQVGDSNLNPNEIVKTATGFKVGEWQIDVELDANKSTAFTITDGKTAMISMGSANVKFSGKSFKPSDKNATFMIELKNGQFKTQEEVDQFPNAAIYY